MAATWQVSGKVMLEENETEGQKKSRALAGVEVKVSASLTAGVYDSWGTTRTKADGSFTLKETISVLFPEKPRKFRVRVCLDSDKLAVTTGLLADPLAGDWITIYESDGKLEGPRVNIGTRTFKAGAKDDLGDLERRRQAIAWYVCRTIMEALTAKDKWLGFQKKVTIVYPARVVSGIPYANGVTRMAYIHSTKGNDWWSLSTLVHEFMHLWNYQHNHGTSNWLQAICDGSTHSYQEKPAIAFHEGFAEYAMEDMLHQLWQHDKVQPWNRKNFKNGDGQRLDSLATVEGSDDGVTNALHLLTTPDIYTRFFGTRTSAEPAATNGKEAGYKTPSGVVCPKSPNLTLWDVLKVFKPAPTSGWKNEWEVGNSAYGVVRFFERASDVLPRFDTETKDLYLKLVDPSSTAEPQDRCRAK